MGDGGILCSKCVLKNYREILTDTQINWKTGWDAIDITNGSEIENTFCSHYGKTLGYK